jgi:hypothetical protein
MGIFSKNKKANEKKGASLHEPAKQLVDQKKTVTIKPDVSTTVAEEKPKLPEKQVQSEIKTAQVSKVTDTNLEFQMMYGLESVAEELPPEVEKTVGKTISTVSEPATTAVKTTEGSKPLEIIPGGGFSSYTKKIFPKPPVKRFVNKQLTIILIENTVKMLQEKDKIVQLVESFTQSDMVCVINYGEKITQSEIFEISSTQKPNISFDEMTGEKVRFFDALVKLEKLVSSKYYATEEKPTENVLIDRIRVIGIGTCIDNCSITPKETALECFEKIASKTKVVNKYFCLTDEYFVNAAEIGFHSIGAICREYQQRLED